MVLGSGLGTLELRVHGFIAFLGSPESSPVPFCLHKVPLSLIK